MAKRAVFRPDETYAKDPYPSRELRLLALFRFHNVIRFFYPYLPSMGEGWDDAFAELWPRFESAADARAYADVVAELAARIPDAHVGLEGPAFDPLLRGASAPMRVEVIDGEPVIAALADAKEVEASGVPSAT